MRVVDIFATENKCTHVVSRNVLVYISKFLAVAFIEVRILNEAKLRKKTVFFIFLPDIKNSEHNRAMVTEFTAISAEHQELLSNCHRMERFRNIYLIIVAKNVSK